MIIKSKNQNKMYEVKEGSSKDKFLFEEKYDKKTVTDEKYLIGDKFPLKKKK